MPAALLGILHLVGLFPPDQRAAAGQGNGMAGSYQHTQLHHGPARWAYCNLCYLVLRRSCITSTGVCRETGVAGRGERGSRSIKEKRDILRTDCTCTDSCRIPPGDGRTRLLTRGTGLSLLLLLLNYMYSPLRTFGKCWGHFWHGLMCKREQESKSW